ncbi:hypothetical protein LTR66_015646 [Elasticomyces elasticus]|nr:hypothetical protein LTR66_015646 [Elasticomyces elasticus]
MPTKVRDSSPEHRRERKDRPNRKVRDKDKDEDSRDRSERKHRSARPYRTTSDQAKIESLSHGTWDLSPAMGKFNLG